MVGKGMAGSLHSLSDTAAMLRGIGRCVVVSHFNPDADAYGSSLGLTLALREAGVEVSVVNVSPLSDRYRFFPGSDEVKNQLPPPQASAGPTALIACDCGALSRIGDDFVAQMAVFSPVVNIDHHSANELFGDYNLVMEASSSTSEIIYRLLEELHLPLSQPVATCLLAGIFGDTGSFRYSCTSADTFSAAAALTRAGAAPSKIVDSLFGNMPIGAVRLQSDALRLMQLHAGGAVAEVTTDRALYAQWGAGPEDADGLAERARDIRGVRIAVLIKEDGDLWRASMRSIDPRYDVSEVARKLGGGGHRVAAAFRWRGDLAELRKRLIPELVALAGAPR